jgi:ParB family transcriptional regulator, chromosome partitioning protein
MYMEFRKGLEFSWSPSRVCGNRIERGFIRPEDEKPKPEAEQAGEASVAGDTQGGDSQAPQDENGEGESAIDEEDDDRPLSDSLVRALTALRTLGMRLHMGEQPEIAIVAATHALSAQIFYLGADAPVVGIQPIKTDLASADLRSVDLHFSAITY